MYSCFTLIQQFYVFYDSSIVEKKPTEPMKIIDDCDENRTGTTVKFKPDSTIFTETTEYKYDILKERLQEIAFLPSRTSSPLNGSSPSLIALLFFA